MAMLVLSIMIIPSRVTLSRIPPHAIIIEDISVSLLTFYKESVYARFSFATMDANNFVSAASMVAKENLVKIIMGSTVRYSICAEFCTCSMYYLSLNSY
jgi:hypothetical protein